jgi:ribonucleoside-diphosphate reductase alpha chain
LKEIMDQLSGIGGGRSLGFGPKRVRSLPDGVSQALAEYLEDTAVHGTVDAYSHDNGNNGYHPEAEHPHEAEPAPALQPTLQIGDLCPECGQAAVINEEGCRKCYACGYSEC